MKKILSLLLVLVCIFSLTSCYQEIRHDSLEEYVERVEKSGFGFSSSSLDEPESLIPCRTFMTDFPYVDGLFHFFEQVNDFTSKPNMPHKCILVLEYDDATYAAAKSYMIEKIEPYNNEFYYCGSYVFYENSNNVEKYAGESYIPTAFNLAGYNDEKKTLCFLGYFVNYAEIDEKYYTDFKGNFSSFIDEFYGEYYDFSE